MKGLKKLIPVIVAAMLLTLVPALALAAEAGVSGTFSVNHPPSIVSITYTGPMDPQSEASITVRVKDLDGKTDLTNVWMKIYYDLDGIWDLSTAQAAAGDVKESGVITWTQTSGTFALVPDPATCTWALGTCLEPADVTGPGGDFTFKITAGQVARETPGQNEGAAGEDRSNACWFIYAKVTDDVAQSDETDAAIEAVEFDMNFWCEVTAITTSVNFGSLLGGATYDDTKQTGNDIKYVANGYYDEKVKTDGTWTRTPAGTDATLDPDSDPALANNFALKADDAAVLTAAVFVPADPTVIAIDEASITATLNNDITDEAGDTVSNILAIQLHTTFEGGTYDGTITFVAVAHTF